MSQYHVVITDFIRGNLSPERDILGGVATVAALDAKDEDELTGHIEAADAIMLYHTLSLTAKTIARLRQCRLIVRCGVGYDNVDHALAHSRNIPVVNVPDYGTEEVADSTLGLMLALTRGIAYLNSRLRSAESPWSHAEAAPLLRLRGMVFAIVGLGRIGTATALRARALGMDVVFYDPYKPDGLDKALGIRRVGTLEELLPQAAVLSLHCPLTDETRHLIDASALESLPRGAYLINTARGAVVDTAAIPAAIACGRLAGAGIDVLEHEPPTPGDPLVCAWRDPAHPAYHRVLLNPHSAFYCEEGLMDIRIKAAEACRQALCGQPLRNLVNACQESR